MTKKILSVVALLLPLLCLAATHTFNGLADPASINGVANADIATVGGVTFTQAAGTTAYCTAATTCSDPPAQCDLLCEDFEGSNECDSDSNPDMDAVCRQTTLAVTIGTNCSADFTSTASGSYPCTQTNTNVLRLVSDTTNTVLVLWDAGAGKPINYSQFYFLLNSESLASNGTAILAQGCTNSTCSTYAWKIVLRDTTGTLTLDYVYYNGVGFTTKNSGAITISTGTWYRVTVKHDYTNTAAEYWINGVSAGSGTDVGNRQPGYYRLQAGGTAGIDVEFDNWTIDDDTAPSACN